jgi:fructose-bisphosphate aldolase class II
MENLNKMLANAQAEHKAVGSFNCYNVETIKGVIKAGEELHQPVIVAFGEKYLDNMSFKEVANLVKAYSEEADIPVCLHLDHCKNVDNVFRAIRAGFSSVMYDGSRLPYEENVKNTRMVTEVAHSSNVSVEAELGSLAAGEKSNEGLKTDKQVYTDPEQAKQFIDETGVDALAVSIGTVHGNYKGKPHIRIDILDDIKKQTGKTPLVLHGGSGTPEETIKDCISHGINKINVNTEISNEVVAKTTALLKEEQPHFSVVSLHQQDYVKETVIKYMKLFNN